MRRLFCKRRSTKHQLESDPKSLSSNTLLLGPQQQHPAKSGAYDTPEGNTSKLMCTLSSKARCRQSADICSNQASESVAKIESNEAQNNFHVSFCSLPRELRDLIYNDALVAPRSIGRWKLCSNYSQLDEVRTLKSLLLACSAVLPHIAQEACETFFGKNTFVAAPWRLAEFLGPESKLFPQGVNLNVMAWIEKIIVTIIDLDSPIPRPRLLASELGILLKCPNLCEVIIDVHETDNFKYLGRNGICFTLCSLAKVCLKLKRRFGGGLKLKFRSGQKLRQHGPEQHYLAEDVSWLLEEQDGLGGDRDKARAAFAECAVTCNFSFTGFS